MLLVVGEPGRLGPTLPGKREAEPAPLLPLEPDGEPNVLPAGRAGGVLPLLPTEPGRRDAEPKPPPGVLGVPGRLPGSPDVPGRL